MSTASPDALLLSSVSLMTFLPAQLTILITIFMGFDASLGFDFFLKSSVIISIGIYSVNLLVKKVPIPNVTLISRSLAFFCNCSTVFTFKLFENTTTLSWGDIFVSR